jgi:hypothetical protein
MLITISMMRLNIIQGQLKKRFIKIIERDGVAKRWSTAGLESRVIAAQMTMLATAQLNGFPTNVSQELGDSATPEQVIDTVVKI